MTAMRRARAEAVCGYVAGNPTGVPISRAVYRDFGRRGLTRVQVDCALDDLVKANRVLLTARGPQVIAYPIEGQS